MYLQDIKQILAELQQQLAGASCVKIHQPRPAVIVIKLWNGRHTLRLLLSAEGRASRLHLTEQQWLNPSTPPRFCQLLRARLSRIDSLEILNEDRIVRVAGQGKQGPCSLILELTGMSSNMHLVDAADRVIDSLQREQGQRRLRPGSPYQCPERIQDLHTSDSPQELVPKPGESLSQAVEKLYSEKRQTGESQDLRQRMEQSIKRRRKKLQKRLQAIDAEAVQQADRRQDRLIGDLLLAHLHRIEPGMQDVTLPNDFADPPETIRIPLDPRLTPQDNAARYYKRSRKFQRAEEHHRRRRQETLQELEWLDQLNYQLEDSVKNSDIEEIAEELRVAGLLREPNRLHARKTQTASQPREAKSPSGFKILCGRNNRQNATLSSRSLNKGDLWFHARDCPGAHVVLKSGQGGRVTDADRSYAAALAAGYSQARQADKVEVMMAQADAVKRPKGAPPGLVTVAFHKTLLVAPQRLDE